MTAPTGARVLCVDDEPNILEGLALHLRRRYEVVTAVGALAALQVIQTGAAPAVVISDMRMPGMDGATFLAKIRTILPDTIRILLTGHTDIDSAIAAINEGQIFRFLTKPCPPAVLLGAVDAGMEQHRLITSERVLLEQTLHGSIKTLVDVLSLANPLAFGRATRVKQHVSDLADKLNLQVRWHVEVAAMLSQLGYVTLPPEVAEKVYLGLSLSGEEQAMVSRLPAVSERLLRHIPRLEIVREILANVMVPFRAVSPASTADEQIVWRGAQMVRVATDFDALENAENTPSQAIKIMRTRVSQYDPLVLDALDELRGRGAGDAEVREVRLSDLVIGMVFVDDVVTDSGVLLVGRGYVVTHGFIERSRNFRRGTVKGPLRVIVPPQA